MAQRLYRLGSLEKTGGPRRRPSGRRRRPADGRRVDAGLPGRSRARQSHRRPDRPGQDEDRPWRDGAVGGGGASGVDGRLLHADRRHVPRRPVYTPPEQRRHGYGSAVTHAVSQTALDADAGDVLLFTDLATRRRTRSTRPGYRPVADYASISFTEPGGKPARQQGGRSAQCLG